MTRMNIKIRLGTTMKSTTTNTTGRDARSNEVSDRPWPELSFMPGSTDRQSSHTSPPSYNSPRRTEQAHYNSSQYNRRNAEAGNVNDEGYSSLNSSNATPQNSPVLPTHNYSIGSNSSAQTSQSWRNRSSTIYDAESGECDWQCDCGDCYTRFYPDTFSPPAAFEKPPTTRRRSVIWVDGFPSSDNSEAAPIQTPIHRTPATYINGIPHYQDILGRWYTPLPIIQTCPPSNVDYKAFVKNLPDYSHFWPPHFFPALYSSLCGSDATAECLSLLQLLATVLKSIPLTALCVEDIQALGKLFHLLHQRRLLYGALEMRGREQLFMITFRQRHEKTDGGYCQLGCKSCDNSGMMDRDPIVGKLGIRDVEGNGGVNGTMKRILHLMNQGIVCDQDEEAWDLFAVVLPKLGRFLMAYAEDERSRFE